MRSTEGESSCGVGKKRKSFTNLDLAKFIQERGIRSYTELFAVAEERRTTEKAKVFLLNDFKWSKNIPWLDILLLLEGETVKLPAPKKIYSEDIAISNDVAIFATTKSSIKHRGHYNASDDRETEMMAARRKAMSFAINFLHKSKKICFSAQDV